MLDKKHYFTIFGTIIIFSIFGSSIFLQGIFQNLVDYLNLYLEGHTLFGPLAFILLAGFSVLLGPFTSAPIAPIAVGLWGTDRTLLYLISGWLIGNTLAYFIGFYIGYPLIKNMFKNTKFTYWTSLLGRKMDIKIALLFRLATPSETGYIFGTIKYNFFKYFFITLIAEIPFAVITVYAGEAFLDAGWKTFLFLGFLWLLLIYTAIYLLDKRLGEKL